VTIIRRGSGDTTKRLAHGRRRERESSRRLRSHVQVRNAGDNARPNVVSRTPGVQIRGAESRCHEPAPGESGRWTGATGRQGVGEPP